MGWSGRRRGSGGEEERAENRWKGQYEGGARDSEGDADPRTEVSRIGSDRQHRLGRRVEQQVIDRGLVVERDVGDLGRQGEDDVEVSDRQQVGLTLGQPRARPGALALGLPTIGQGKSMAGR